MISGVLHRYPILSGLWRTVLDAPPPYDQLPLEVELGHPVDAMAELARHIEDEFKSRLGARARVTLLEPHSLPRTEGKTRYVIRNYK